MRRAARTDGNQQAIVKAFRKLGCWVCDLHSLGGGVPDLLIAVPPSHALALVEVKDGSKPPSKRKLTDAEEDFKQTCPSMVWIVKDLGDVQTVVKYYRYG